MTIILLSAIGLFGLAVIGLPLLVLFSHVILENMVSDGRRATGKEQGRW